MLKRADIKRRLYHYGLGAGMPLPLVRGVADRIDAAAHLRSIRARRRAARALLARVRPPVRIDRATAFATFGPGQFAEIPALVKLGSEIAAEREPELPPLKGENTFWHLLRPGDLAGRCRPLLDFALSDGMLAMVCDHLGAVPRLFHLDLWLSPPLPHLTGSHRYHLDKPDGEIFSVFVNIGDVGPGAGPFTFLPADVSARVCRATRYDLIYYRGGKRLEDAEVERVAGPDAALRLTGPAGSGGIVNTSRCLHLGSRCVDQSRLVLAIKFALAHKVPASYAAMFAGHPYGRDPLRSLVLEGSA